MRACLAHAGKPSKDSGSGTQEQTYVKTVIELHDKYLQVCSRAPLAPKLSLCTGIRRICTSQS